MVAASHNTEYNRLHLGEESTPNGEVSYGLVPVRRVEGKPCRLPSESPPWFPPQELRLDLFFFRQLFAMLEAQGHVNNGEIHVAKLQSVAVRLLDVLGTNGLDYFGARFFGCERAEAAGKVRLSWEDMRKALESETVDGFPEVKLNVGERIYLTLEDPASSLLSRCYTSFMTLVIGLNLTLIILQTMDNCQAFLPTEEDSTKCGSSWENLFVLVFSFDYLMKVFAVAQVRPQFYDRDMLLQLATQCDPNYENYVDPVLRSWSSRVWHWATNAQNLVDLCSVLPFWINILFGTLLPPSSTSFLRAIRLLRMFRVLKTGRYSLTLQALGKVLTRSFRSVTVLLMYIIITSLIAGVVLQQVERGETFDDVPNATWWVFVRLIGSHHSSPYAEGRPISVVGCILVAGIMMCKGILWILPFGQIGTVFREEWAEIEKTQALKSSLLAETASENDLRCNLERTISAHIEIFSASDRDTGAGDLLNVVRMVEGLPTSPSERLLTASEAHQDDACLLSSRQPPWASNSLPVPILKADFFHKKFTVPLVAGYVAEKRWLGPMPQVDVEVMWKPDFRMKDLEMPCGVLKILSLSGHDFGGNSQDRWILRLSAPVALKGGRHHKESSSRAPKVDFKELQSESGGPEPQWAVPSDFEFHVDWSLSGIRDEEPSSVAELPPPKTTRDQVSDKSTDFERRVLEMLEAQSKGLAEQSSRLAALEEKVNMLRPPRGWSAG